MDADRAEGGPHADETVDLLQRWHRGDRGALETLLRRELPWIERKVRARLGPRLRAKEETLDVVQEALLEFLEYGPRFLVAGRGQLRALLARIVENVLRARHDWYSAKRRALSRERPLPAESVVSLDGSVAHRASMGPTPSAEVAAEEEAALVRLGLEVVDPADREVILLREWEGLSHAEVARKLGTSEDAARMRYTRALARLAGWIADLRRGSIEGRLEEAADEARARETRAGEEGTGEVTG
jgi:RNA polymerase sigma-70 factor (ECF subfamily)